MWIRPVTMSSPCNWLKPVLLLFQVGKKIGQPVTINADGSINSENQVKPQTASHVAKRAGDEDGAQPPPKKPLQVKLSAD